jgi:hypothetical protein
LVNEVFAQYAFETRPRDPNNSELVETVVLLLPTFQVAGSWGQNWALPNAMDESRIQVVDTIRYFAGRHVVKGGINLDFVDFDNLFCGYCSGSYAFLGWDAFLDGPIPFGYRQRFSLWDGEVALGGDVHSAFVSDEWHVDRRVTVSYGIRYEIQIHDQPPLTNPLYPDTGRIPDDTDNWSVRAAVAWDVRGDGKHVVRGGFGRFYDVSPTILDANAVLNNGAVGLYFDQLCVAGDACPNYPEVWQSPADVEGEPPSIFVFDPRFENPETDRFSFGYEGEIGKNLSVGIDLIHSRTRKLERKQDQNIVPSDGSTTPDGRPVYGGRGLDPNFDQIIQFTSDARAEYTAVMVRAHKRFSDGWFLDASYTWSDARDNDSNERSVSRSNDFSEDQFNLANDWGPSAFDVRHKVVASVVCRLPLNFQIAAVGVYRTGFPYSALDARDNNGDSYRNERALIETSGGEWVHFGRNGERQPDFKTLDLRLSWAPRLGFQGELELIGEVFNLTNEANWYNAGNQVLVGRNGSLIPTFGEFDSVGSPRRFQLGARVRF